MYTIIIIASLIAISALITLIIVDDDIKNLKITIGYLTVIFGLGAAMVITQQIVINSSKPQTIETPNKYTTQDYYINNNNRLYINQNGTMKNFGGDITDKIEYSDVVKTPTITFKTIKKIKPKSPDDWIPFKYKTETKTSIVKIVLPKSALTEKLTKVDVVNSANTSDLSLSD